MRQPDTSLGLHKGHQPAAQSGKKSHDVDFALEKDIFEGVFEKDIQRVYIYKKAERLAKALQLIMPAFSESDALRGRLDHGSVSLIEASLLPPAQMKRELSRALLALAGVVSVSRTGGLLSQMNGDILSTEIQSILQDVARYEEPRMTLEDSSTLAEIAHRAPRSMPARASKVTRTETATPRVSSKGQLKDRSEAILDILRKKGSAGIKDVSTLIRGISEKTVQRELAMLVDQGEVIKEGERRWSVYRLAK